MIKKLKNYILIFLAVYNKNCRVYSSKISANSLNGHNIQIQNGVLIDLNSKIASYTYIGSFTSITKCNIGRYCSIANNVSIGVGEHILSKVSTSSLFYENVYETLTKDYCEIGNDVWIGVDAIVLRGTRIGTGAVVAANAVVTKDVPPFAIVAGVPAIIIGYRFNEFIQKIIIDSEWWKFDFELARNVLNEIEIIISNNNK